jgi:hypothetical protein
LIGRSRNHINFCLTVCIGLFALGAIFSLAAITAAQSRFNTKKAFLVANLLGVAVVAATFLMLYLLSGTKSGLSDSSFVRVSVIAASRVSAAIIDLASYNGYPLSIMIGKVLPTDLPLCRANNSGI